MPEPQKQRLHFASTALGDERFWGIREDIFLCLQSLKNFRYKNYIGCTDSQETFLRLSDQVWHVLCFSEPWVGQCGRIDPLSKQPPLWSISQLMLGPGREDSMRFRNVCVTVESWKLSRGLSCESHQALRVPGTARRSRAMLSGDMGSWFQGDSSSLSSSLFLPPFPFPSFLLFFFF